MARAINKFEVKVTLEPESVFRDPGASISDLQLRKGGLIEDPALRRMTVSFLDSKEQQLRSQGWTVRYRVDLRKNGEVKGVKSSYKRRYKVEGDGEDALRAASDKATDDLGADIEALELDWSRARRVLSASFSGHDGGEVAPGIAATTNLPAALAPFRAMLLVPHEFGPAKAIRWSGANDTVGQNLELELWKLPDAPDILEVSFEEQDASKAAMSRAALIEAIEGSAWVATGEDALRTDALFAAFGA